MIRKGGWDTVIGDEDESCGGHIQAADGEQPWGDGVGVTVARLVQGEVVLGRGLGQRLPADGDLQGRHRMWRGMACGVPGDSPGMTAMLAAFGLLIDRESTLCRRGCRSDMLLGADYSYSLYDGKCA